MSQFVEKLFSIKTGDDLSFDECQRINAELASIKASDIPPDQSENVRDYLVSALNHGNVEDKLKKNLDALLLQINDIVK